MIDPIRQQTPRTRRSRGIALRVGVVAVVVAVAAVFAAMALASSSSVSVNSASNSKLGQRILVTSSGRTLYELSPETTSHLLCKSSECLKFWPPLKAGSASGVKLGSGVHGKVGILHRAGGVSQVTLNGHPLYTFAEDKGSGEVNGQNFKGFGGIWHVLSTSGAPSAKEAAATNAPASAPAAPSTPAAPTNTESTPSSGGYSSGGYTY
jgi:predicted lipoprotein with Yx(FWY)xxD motif